MTITIRVIDSKTGKVLHGEDSYNPAGLWLFDEQAKPIPIRLTDQMLHKQGGETREVQNATTIQIFADGFIDCRNIAKGRGPHYPVEEILQRGIVTANHCTSRTTSPVPGMIVLFVRDRNWFERHFRE